MRRTPGATGSSRPYSNENSRRKGISTTITKRVHQRHSFGPADSLRATMLKPRLVAPRVVELLGPTEAAGNPDPYGVHGSSSPRKRGSRVRWHTALGRGPGPPLSRG